MKFGFTSMCTPDDVPPARLATDLEDRGWESVWLGEHSHIPARRTTPYPLGGELPAQYTKMMDPFVALAVAGEATTSLRLGLGVCLPLEHDVFALAKTVATLDQVSDGRVLFGVGTGWNVEQLADHRPDVPWKLRYSALGESVQALQSLWRDDESSFHGRWFDFEPVWSFPKPRQRPHPPVLCGTNGPAGTAQAVQWADEWMPLDADAGDLARKLVKVRASCDAVGRDPASLRTSVVAFGDPEPESLMDFAELGVHRVILGSGRRGWDDAATTYPFLDRYQSVVADFGEPGGAIGNSRP